jgi:hypothetical protein
MESAVYCEVMTCNAAEVHRLLEECTSSIFRVEDILSNEQGANSLPDSFRQYVPPKRR